MSHSVSQASVSTGTADWNSSLASCPSRRERGRSGSLRRCASAWPQGRGHLAPRRPAGRRALLSGLALPGFAALLCRQLPCSLGLGLLALVPSERIQIFVVLVVAPSTRHGAKLSQSRHYRGSTPLGHGRLQNTRGGNHLLRNPVTILSPLCAESATGGSQLEWNPNDHAPNHVHGCSLARRSYARPRRQSWPR